MNSKIMRWLVMGVISLVAGLLTEQWVAGNIAIQIGGSNNHIEQKVDSGTQPNRSPAQ